jgi:riboflavin kinase/FMN adenylyltransferase
MNLPAKFDSLDRLDLPVRPLHLAIGMFDGVHLGHQAVIESAVHSARRSDGLAGVLTFWPHPSAVFNPDGATRMLMTPEIKARILFKLGVDIILQQTFSREFAGITVDAFLPYLLDRLPHLKGIYVGENWRFGAGRKGDVRGLLAEAAKHRLSVLSVPRILWDGEPISSTRVRDCVAAGRMEEANMLLGYSYFAEGVVMGGRRLGRTIGFPTLNLQWAPALKPCYGVYAVRVKGDSGGPAFPAVANYGLRPTVGQADAPLLEANLLDACPFAEGNTVTVEWLSFIRAEQKFADLQMLREQIVRDRSAAEAYFQAQGPTP